MGVVVQRRQLTGRGRAHNETGASSARESSSSSTAAQRQHNSAHARQQQRRRLDVCQQTPAQRVWRAQGSGKKTKNRKQQVRCCLWLLGAQRRRWWENGAARVCVCVCVCVQRGAVHTGARVWARALCNTQQSSFLGALQRKREEGREEARPAAEARPLPSSSLPINLAPRQPTLPTAASSRRAGA